MQKQEMTSAPRMERITRMTAPAKEIERSERKSKSKTPMPPNYVTSGPRSLLSAKNDKDSIFLSLNVIF